MSVHTLYIKVVEGHDLLAADSNGFSDPYAKITVDKVAHKSQVIKTTLNPKWNETFTFDKVHSSSSCNIRIKDWNRLSASKFLGSVDVALANFVSGQPKAKWYTLQYYDPQKGHVPAGKILLVIHLAEKGGRSQVESIPTDVSKKLLNFVREGAGQLLIEVVEGRALAVKDISGTSDPYCVLKIGKQISKTNIVEKNLDPVWNEAFSFEIITQMYSFIVEVFDWDALSKDDPMGMVQINMKSLEDENPHDEWYTLVPQKNEKVSGQIRLKLQYTSPQNSHKSYIIAKENYTQISMILTGGGLIISTHLLQSYESQELAVSMAHVFNGEKKFIVLLKECLRTELQKSKGNLFFKGESPTTKLLVAYFKWVDGECGYLKSAIMPVVNYIIENPSGFEVDPGRSKRTGNAAHLQETSQRMLNSIFASRVPMPIREVLATVKQQISDERVTNAIGDVLFVRFICAAIVAPENFGLLGGVTPNVDARRSLALISKVIQNLASDFPFGEKEPFMAVFNPFIDSNKPAYKQFIGSATEYPLHGDDLEAFPVKYHTNDKFHHMSIVVKNLHNNFAVISSQILSFSKDVSYTAEMQLYLTELGDIFSKYQS
eukprot:Phypoly_transcript_05612.p1 GENE.Phypoly_transcript_05612~~Phypoly_transcript_05612.p1  ORF type:complete len:602 (-),score=84.00 Phypoly_transcript_05612:29-1834(-)